ncbi:MAG: RsmF rRNA methyltransferase first C-terminal domain-containing protein [Clostridia bacterium]|nr:RsmF rRNA methyltransferase first C-terminal domain-containing protein [Clostridia bacterium]
MNLPKDFIDRMSDMLGDEMPDFLDAMDKTPINTGLRINTLKDGARESVLSELSSYSPVPWCDDGYYISKSELSGTHPYHMGGLIYFQEPSAMSTVCALPINKGDFVLDLCAAPGGKATQVAGRLCGSGFLVANEIVKKRADILSDNIKRLGIKNAVVTNESPKNLENKFPHFFNKIIVDAPCSGEGMFRKEPQAVDCWSVEHTLSCADRQRHILDSAMSMLRGGGYLVYSTCTFSPDENEKIVDYVLDTYKNIELCDIKSLTALSNGIIKCSKYENITYTKRIFPHKQNGEGHFVALFHNTDAKEDRNIKTAKANNNALYREFENKFLNTHLDGTFVTFGDNLYLMSENIDLNKLKVVSPGLYLGTLKKNRFEPSYALALALKKEDFKNTLDCSLDMINAYFKGETLKCGHNGWTALLYNGYPMGFGKASGGVLKNHYPKWLRLM